MYFLFFKREGKELKQRTTTKKKKHELIINALLLTGQQNIARVKIKQRVKTQKNDLIKLLHATTAV